MSDRRWRVRLLGPARTDFISIIEWSVERFGVLQAEAYRDAIRSTLRTLEDGPGTGFQPREDIRPGLFSAPVGGASRRGRHLVFFRERPGRVIEVVRILHDGMDFSRHLPAARK